MPKFEDTRKFKISTIFKGQDLLKDLLGQVRAALAGSAARLHWPSVPATYRPADTIRVSAETLRAVGRLAPPAATAAAAAASLLDGPAALSPADRLWLAPSSFAPEREAGGAPPLVSFRAVQPSGRFAAGSAGAAALAVSDADAKAFATLPLAPIGLATCVACASARASRRAGRAGGARAATQSRAGRRAARVLALANPALAPASHPSHQPRPPRPSARSFVGRRPARAPGTTPAALPFDLSSQPLARTSVGRATLRRLGDDLRDYAAARDGGGGLEMLHLLEDQLAS